MKTRNAAGDEVAAKTVLSQTTHALAAGIETRNDFAVDVDHLLIRIDPQAGEGIVQDGEIICSWHGWRVCLQDGSCRRERERARTYPCEVRGDEVWVQV